MLTREQGDGIDQVGVQGGYGISGSIGVQHGVGRGFRKFAVGRGSWKRASFGSGQSPDAASHLRVDRAGAAKVEGAGLYGVMGSHGSAQGRQIQARFWKHCVAFRREMRNDLTSTQRKGQILGRLRK